MSKSVNNTFNGIKNDDAGKGMEAVQIFSTNSHLTQNEQKQWQEIYKADLKKPHWSSGNKELDKQRRDRYARQSADIAIGKSVWMIK